MQYPLKITMFIC